MKLCAIKCYLYYVMEEVISIAGFSSNNDAYAFVCLFALGIYIQDDDWLHCGYTKRQAQWI